MERFKQANPIPFGEKSQGSLFIHMANDSTPEDIEQLLSGTFTPWVGASPEAEWIAAL